LDFSRTEQARNREGKECGKKKRRLETVCVPVYIEWKWYWKNKGRRKKKD
jgi:hypothetical protein